MLGRPVYFLQRAWRSMRQNPFLSLATVATVTVALALAAIFFVLLLNLQGVARQWSREIQVVIYLQQPPSPATLQQWQRSLNQLPQVEGVSYVPPPEAFRRFQQRLGSNDDLLAGVSPEVLPASLEISLKEASRNRSGVAAVVAVLRQNPAFADLRYGQDWLERFDSLMLLLRWGGGAVGGFLLVAALFIVANTIRLTLYARRDEIEIMLLAGATPAFIKIPFILEGMMLGAVGSGVALLMSHLAIQMLLRRGFADLLQSLGVERVLFLDPAQQGLLIAAGILLGTVGSLAALRRLQRG